MFKVHVNDDGKVRILELSGRLLLGPTITTLEKTVMSTLTEEHRQVLFDFSRVEAIDSAGIGALAIYRKRAAEHKVEIKAVIPPGSRLPLHVQTPIRLLFDTHDEVVKAIVAF